MSNPSRHRPFDFNGNHLAVDFTNTVNARPVFTRDDLADADDSVRVGSRSRIAARHADPVKPRSDDVAGGLRRLDRAPREHLPSASARSPLGRIPMRRRSRSSPGRAAAAITSAEWVKVGPAFRPQWAAWSLDAIGDRLADEAMSLLRSPVIARLGACAGCGWLFVDTSRAHARRWCSMNACGVRDKMRRYHRRQATAGRPA